MAFAQQQHLIRFLFSPPPPLSSPPPPLFSPPHPSSPLPHPSHPHITHSDNLSPPFLIYNTPLLMLDNLEFTNNWPQNLSSEIARNRCYFSGRQDLFFLDNRTTSGGFSFFIEDKQLSFLITNCTFRNNSARPDVYVSLPRNSDGYGHGGAANIRLVNSSDSRVCILESVFEDNFAQAHSGGLAIALAGESSQNRFAVVNTTFNNNWCQVVKCTAGAVGIDFYTDTLNNQVLLLNINFINNTADTGGAVSLTTAVSAKQNSEGESDKLVLTECMFESNKAFFEGTALGAFSLTHGDQIGVPVEVVNWYVPPSHPHTHTLTCSPAHPHIHTLTCTPSHSTLTHSPAHTLTCTHSHSPAHPSTPPSCTHSSAHTPTHLHTLPFHPTTAIFTTTRVDGAVLIQHQSPPTAYSSPSRGTTALSTTVEGASPSWAHGWMLTEVLCLMEIVLCLGVVLPWLDAAWLVGLRSFGLLCVHVRI